ncbi:hypothetical protein [Caulobacter endophyticus]|uniref:hypothetical protein n=1 Tax=Caulobacter endophyticus TaxID=2172652 RepID=UPI00240F2075|nr:hypothetical protein [Caulobacter endophyticus]MDG2528826.1 hypothetical protein [Caulobacter endophyticus]
MSLSHALLIAAAIVATAVGTALWRRRLERGDLELALYPEVVGLHRQAAQLATELARRHAQDPGLWLDEAFFARWRLSAPLVYPAAAGGLGRLSGGARDRVGYFYAQLAEARLRLGEARAAGGVIGSPYRLVSNLVRACNHVEPWVGAMERRLGPSLLARPNLAAANVLLGALEEAGGEPLVDPWFWADTAYEPD